MHSTVSCLSWEYVQESYKRSVGKKGIMGVVEGISDIVDGIAYWFVENWKYSLNGMEKNGKKFFLEKNGNLLMQDGLN